MKIVFFGTSNVALPILESLSRSHQVLAVVTSPDAKVGRQQELTESPVSVLAKELNLPILKPNTAKNNLELESQLKNFGVDIFVVVSYGKILPLSIINLPEFKTVNVHFSQLPKYRGAAPIQYVLMDGLDRTGISVFLLDEKVDHGPMLFQQEAAVDPDDNFITLSQKLAQTSARLLPQILTDYENGKIIPQNQDEGQASFTKIITKQDGKIDWNMPAQTLYNRFRAFYPWPGIWTEWNGKKLKITDCLPIEISNSDVVGKVLPDGVVMTGNGGLKIKLLQLEGKNEVSIQDFLNGNNRFIGSVL